MARSGILQLNSIPGWAIWYNRSAWWWGIVKYNIYVCDFKRHREIEDINASLFYFTFHECSWYKKKVPHLSYVSSKTNQSPTLSPTHHPKLTFLLLLPHACMHANQLDDRSRLFWLMYSLAFCSKCEGLYWWRCQSSLPYSWWGEGKVLC